MTSAPSCPADGGSIACWRVTKPNGQSTISLHNALIQDESLTVALLCFEPGRPGAAGGSGTEPRFLTTVLSNARLTALETIMPNNLLAATQALPQYEELAFIYDAIDGSYKPGNKVAADN